MNFVKDPNDQKQKNPLYQSLLKVKNISQALTEFLLSETKQRATRFHDTRQNVNCSMKCTLFRTCIGEGKTVYTHTHMHTHRQNIKSSKHQDLQKCFTQAIFVLLMLVSRLLTLRCGVRTLVMFLCANATFFVQAEVSSRCLSRSTDRNFSCMFPGASFKSK